MKSILMKSVMGAKTLESAAAKTFHRGVLACAMSLAFAGFPTVGSADHSWGGYHWARTANPFTLKLGDNVSSVWDSYLATTSADWSTSSVLNTTIVPGSSTGKLCRSANGRVEVCNYGYGNTGWLGVAQIWVRGTHITRGTVKVNDTYHNAPPYSDRAWRNLVMCQEVGHTFGLDHQDEEFDNPNLGTCMDYTSNPIGPPSNEHPNAHDYEQLELIYAHQDAKATVAETTTGSNMPPAMTEIDYFERSQWGKLIRSSKNGLKEVYLLDFGRGHKLFTFVTWVEGKGRGRK